MKSLTDILNKYNINSISLVDVGAKGHIEFIEELRTTTHLHAFEPNNIECNKLKAKYHQVPFKTIAINNFGLAQKTGNLKFYISHHAAMSGLLEPDIVNYEKHFGSYLEFTNWKNDIATVKETTIKCISLDDYSNGKLEEIDYIKIDTQGTELDILKGAEQLLKQRKVHLIKVEVATISIYKNQVLFADIDVFLRNHLYQLVDFVTYRNENMTVFKNKTWKHAPCGDAIYVLNAGDLSQSRCIKNGIILHWLGYKSLSSYYLKKTNLNQNEMDSILKIKIYNSISFSKRFLKVWLPPILYKTFFS